MNPLAWDIFDRFDHQKIKKMKKIVFLTTVAPLLFIMCKPLKPVPACAERIVGNWNSVENVIHFNSLLFSPKGSCVFTSRADTMFRYGYSIDCAGSTISLVDIDKKASKLKFRYISQDSLLISGLPETNQARKYVRVK